MKKIILIFGAFFCLFTFISASSKPKKEIKKQETSADRLKSHVQVLSEKIGERNFSKPKQLSQSADYIKTEFTKMGYSVNEQTFTVRGYEPIFTNIIAEKKGISSESIIFLAHYDSAQNAPGADDNASGVALLLELARQLYPYSLDLSVKFVAATNEEPPFFKTSGMGSYRYAKHLAQKKEKIRIMYSLESLGYFSSQENSQKYPFPLKYFYPSTGDYISFISNLTSKKMKDLSLSLFKETASIKTQDIAVSPLLVKAASLSDQWAFWNFGYKAIMITDTAFYRTEYYHTPFDTYEKLDYEIMADILKGLENMAVKISNDEN